MSRNTQERRDTSAGGHEAALTTAAPALILPSPGHAVWSPPALATCLPSLPSTLHGRPHWLIYPPRTPQGSVGHIHCPRGFCPDWSEPRPSPPKSPSSYREPALSSISGPDQTLSLVSCPPSRGHPHPHTTPSPPLPSHCAPDPAAARTTRLCSTPIPASKPTLHRTPNHHSRTHASTTLSSKHFQTRAHPAAGHLGPQMLASTHCLHPPC